MKLSAATNPIRPFALGLAVLAVSRAPAAASTAQEFLDAPVWYLEYEVAFTSNHSGTYAGGSGPVSFTIQLERVFSGLQKLNLRSGGPGPLAMAATAGTGEDAQKMAMDMMAAMEYTANWMVGGAAMEEGATDEDIAADSRPSSPLRVDYTRVDTGKNLVDEMGEKFDWTRTTTVKGTGMVLAGGFGAVFLEMNTKEKSYALSLPLIFNAMSTYATQEVVDITTYPGKAPVEDRKTSEVAFDLFPGGLALDEEQQGGMSGGAVIRGVLDPSTGKISGEQSFPAHYLDQNQATPGTAVFKYTLTMSPPKK